MTDLRTRMRIFDQVPTPDYWTEIELRASTAPLAASPARRVRPALLLVAALLLALVIGGAALALSGIVELPVPPGSSFPRLAYSVDGDIYLADWDGGNAILVADGVAGDGGSPQCGSLYGGVWAPDGRHLAFRSEWSDECPGEVHVVDAEGRLVASVPGSGWDVSWSPDATRFATWVELWRTIGIYSLGGERQALLTVTPGCAGSGDHDPRWMPDGDSVVVVTWLCEIPIDGGAPLRIPATDPRHHYMWSYSPDGTRVAYVSPTVGVGGDAIDRSLVIAEADGTVLQVVDEESPPVPWIYSLVWSPSGDRVLFGWNSLSEALELSDVSELRLVEIGTGQVTTLAAAPEIWPIRFSPDGNRILYMTRDSEASTSGLWSMDADGSHAQLLVSNPDYVSGDWQPLTGGN